ncbi:hypothetical protein ES702_01257 [subsurface metagenome]
MTQEEIIEVLEKNKEETLTAEDIAQIININTVAVRTSLNRLLKGNEVKRVKLNKKEVEKLEKSFSGRHYCWELN